MNSGGAGHAPAPVPTLPVGHGPPPMHMAGQGSHNTTPRDGSARSAADRLAPAAWLGQGLQQPPEPAGPPRARVKLPPDYMLQPKVKQPPVQRPQQLEPPPPPQEACEP